MSTSTDDRRSLRLALKARGFAVPAIEEELETGVFRSRSAAGVFVDIG